jgi:hypothetical protein
MQEDIDLLLMDDEKKLYGISKRYPSGYNKIGILGKGGCAVVWKCENIITKN